MDLKKIEKALIKIKDEPRPYIGASSIGNPCERAIWYGLHHSDKKIVSAKQRMTFQIGHALETLVINWLIGAGFRLIADLPMNYLLATECKELPIFRGTMDALLWKKDGTQELIEIKTAKDSSFQIFKKKGVRLWYPQYYDQMQSYMGMAGLSKGWLIALNKDTSELHVECVHFDAEHYKRLVEKARMISEAVIEPARISNSASYFKCKICSYSGECFK